METKKILAVASGAVGVAVPFMLDERFSDEAKTYLMVGGALQLAPIVWDYFTESDGVDDPDTTSFDFVTIGETAGGLVQAYGAYLHYKNKGAWSMGSAAPLATAVLNVGWYLMDFFKEEDTDDTPAS